MTGGARGRSPAGPSGVPGRQVLVSITPAGESEVRETRRRRDEWLAGRLATLDPEERELLARATVLLSRLSES